MIDEDISEQIKEDVAAIEPAKVLLGLMNRPQAMQWLLVDYSVRNRWGPQLSQSERDEILAENEDEFEEVYNEAKEGLQEPTQFQANQIELEDLPEDTEVQEYVSQFTNSDYFTEAYGDFPEGLWEIKLVPIKALVAWQAVVTTTAHTEIPTSDDGILDLMKYCLPVDMKNYLQVEGNSVQDQYSSVRFVSRNPNINFSGPEINVIEERPAGNVTVSFDVKARPNFVQVAKFQGRYFLKNGYHRCYQLLQAGEEYVPALVIYAQNYQQTGAAGSGWFPQERLLGQRPPLVHDFTTDVAADIEVKNRNKMVRILAEKMDVEH